METLVLSENESVTLVAGGVYALTVQAHGVVRSSAGVLTPYAAFVPVPDTNQVTVVAAPAPGTHVLLKEIVIHNPSGGNATVTLRITRGGVTYVLFLGTIATTKTYRLSDNLHV